MESNNQPVLDWNLIQLFWLFLSRVFTEAEQDFERGNMGFKQIVLLAILERPQSPQDLRRMLGGPASTMSNTLNDLEKRGYVLRAIHATDRRSFVIHRTSEGDRVLAEAILSLEAVLKNLSGNLNEEQLGALLVTKSSLSNLVGLPTASE